MLGSMAAVPLPPTPGARVGAEDSDPLQEALFFNHRIEVPITTLASRPGRLLRVSAQLYNELSEYRLLCDALLLF
jgi:isopenicillin-N epimerase